MVFAWRHSPHRAGRSIARPALCRREPAYNSIFVEGGGPGLLYSLNYERVVENDFGLRVGMSYVSFSASAGSSSASATILAVPVIFSYLGLRGGNHISSWVAARRASTRRERGAAAPSRRRVPE